jgi:F-type H+-transporting ATPase subunit a
MPEHTTWWAFLPGYDNWVEALSAWLSGNLGEGWGKTLMGFDLDLQHVIGALFILLVLFLVGLWVSASVRDVKKAIEPETKLTLRTFCEIFMEVVLGFAEDLMGRKAARALFPLVGTAAFFIFFSNFSGFIPGLAPPTSNWNMTLAMAIVVFLSTHIFGVKEHGLSYFKEFLGPIVKWYALPLMLFMVVVESIGHLVRPMSLSIRLMGNMTADHTVAAVFLGLIPLLVPLPVMLLGVLVAVVQTLVFILLSMTYIGMAMEHHEESH